MKIIKGKKAMKKYLINAVNRHGRIKLCVSYAEHDNVERIIYQSGVCRYKYFLSQNPYRLSCFYVKNACKNLSDVINAMMNWDDAFAGRYGRMYKYAEIRVGEEFNKIIARSK